MNFALSPEQEQIRDAIERVCAPFDDDCWMRKDKEGGFPVDFHRALAEATLMMQTIARAAGSARTNWARSAPTATC